ncbi:MAG: SMP-30/gluconolactonase/LRE family protein, partial [Nitrospiraceae bacterium]
MPRASTNLLAVGAAMIIAAALPTDVIAANLKQVALPGEHAYPESIAAAADGTLYVSSLASGGIVRIK